MYLNQFAPGLEPLDLSGSAEFESLCQSARELGLPVPDRVRYASRNVVLNGLRFHLLEWGDPAAPAVVLLHGGNQSAHSWDLVSLALAERWHVIALDQRGHGDSEWPRDGDRSREAMAEDVLALIRALGLTRPAIMGHSMGGIVAMTLLAARPELARKAVLVDVGPRTAREGAELILAFIRSSREFDSIEEFVERVTAYDPFRPREHVERTVRYNLMRRSDGKFVSKHDSRRWDDGQADQGRSRPTLADVARIGCPVLVVRGEQSPVLPAEAAEEFARALPDGRLVTVPACGHNVHSQNTRGFLEATLGFLA